MKVIQQIVNKKYALYQGDSVQVIKGIPDNSIGYSLFSPPFAELYTYSDNIEDMGNSKDYKQFFEQFQFLINELHRVIMPGRSVSIHCVDIPAMKERDGYIGLKDFPGDIIRAFQKEKFVYHSRVTIWKNPLVEATRTKAIGLLHKQLCKDSAACRQGTPDYIITMRKRGVNPVPIDHPNGFEDYIGNNEPTETGIKFSHETWRRYASPVWMDIRQGKVLRFKEARIKNDEKHISPLQLDVIQRCLRLWSNPGDTFLTPFMGIGSEVYEALKYNLKPIGIELKESYYSQTVKHVKRALKQKNDLLFDGEI